MIDKWPKNESNVINTEENIIKININIIIFHNITSFSSKLVRELIRQLMQRFCLAKYGNEKSSETTKPQDAFFSYVQFFGISGWENSLHHFGGIHYNFFA